MSVNIMSTFSFRRLEGVSASRLTRLSSRSQVTQEICDPSRVFRLLGSDRSVPQLTQLTELWKESSQELPNCSPALVSLSIPICHPPTSVIIAVLSQVLLPGNQKTTRPPAASPAGSGCSLWFHLTSSTSANSPLWLFALPPYSLPTHTSPDPHSQTEVDKINNLPGHLCLKTECFNVLK